jgi:hypothetical protein
MSGLTVRQLESALVGINLLIKRNQALLALLIHKHRMPAISFLQIYYRTIDESSSSIVQMFAESPKRHIPTLWHLAWFSFGVDRVFEGHAVCTWRPRANRTEHTDSPL